MYMYLETKIGIENGNATPEAQKYHKCFIKFSRHTALSIKTNEAKNKLWEIDRYSGT